MRMMTVLLLSAVVAACQGGSPTTSADTGLPQNTSIARSDVGQPFELRIGEISTVGNDGLRLTFVRVENDSRCPIDAICVWMGDAEIALKIEQGTQKAVAALHTTLDPKKTVWGKYTIALVSLAPAPRASETTPPASYVARLLVTQ